jgi:predicted RNase H-like nuclease (RuvC/YqgF family)
MNIIHEQFRKNTIEAWETYMKALETSIDQLEKDIDEAADMSERCTDEWCTATEHVIDEINDALFNISEPRWASKEESDRIKHLKRRVRDLYTRYMSTRSERTAA